MSTLTIKNLNKSIDDNSEIISLMRSGKLHNEIKLLQVDWKKFTINTNSKLYSFLVNQEYVHNNSNSLTDKGKLFLSRLSIDFKENLLGQEVDNKYVIKEVIHLGKNSATFIAKHKLLQNKLVLKFVRPGAAENLSSALQIITSKGQNISGLAHPVDFFNAKVMDIFKQPVEVECIVFPYISGITLRKFLSVEDQPITAHFVASFIKQISHVLAQLETIGAYHGDLHEENILVHQSEAGVLSFNIIDVSFGINGSVTSNVCKDTDIENFRHHICKILNHQQIFLKKMSVRKYLGAEVYHIVSNILSNNFPTFTNIIGLFEQCLSYDEFRINKERFLDEKFKPPGQFKLQRYEEITDPEVALKLFHPFEELMDDIKKFSNIVISGNRGSGKSTYLAAIGYFSRVEDPIVSFKECFGIYFPCRQGEFRLMSDDFVDYDGLGASRVKHVIIIKVIRRCLESIADAMDSKQIQPPRDFDKVKSVLSQYVNKGEIISLEPAVISEVRNLVSLMIRIEMKELDNLFHSSSSSLSKRLATESDLINFFKALKETFSELSTTKFHLLFDDAGSPNIPTNTQKILNDLIVSSNPYYCVKISIERHSYTFHSTNNKSLESGHDYYEYDMSRVFFTGAKTFGLSSEMMEEYCYKIVQKRLKHFNYKSDDIKKYLGESSEIKFDAFVSSLANSRRNAYFNSWTMVWKLSDRTPRNLLELISEIFSVDNINKNSNPEIVSSRNQDRAIRAVSEKRLKSLSQISGVIDVNSQSVSLGRQIFDVTSSIASVFRIYLKSEAGKTRKDQYLALERNDGDNLSSETEVLLKEMIRYGVLDESRLDYARDDMVKRPIYVLNRIYCPAFGISYRRDQHLRLSRIKFEEVFLKPRNFINDGTKRLRKKKDPSEQHQVYDLFEGLSDDS